MRYAVIDDVQYNQGVYLLVFIKAWEIQERHRENELKNDPALTGMMVWHIMMHDVERTLKQQLTQLTKHGNKIDALYSRIGDYHNEDMALHKKVKEIVDNVNFPK